MQGEKAQLAGITPRTLGGGDRGYRLFIVDAEED
jgi:hypothetical protein